MKPMTHPGQGDLMQHMESLSVLSHRMRQELEVSLQIEKKKTETLNQKILEIQANAELSMDKTQNENVSLKTRVAQQDAELKKWRDAYKNIEAAATQKAKEADQFQRQAESLRNTWEAFQENFQKNDHELKKANADVERLRTENRELHRELAQEKRNAMNALQISTESARDMKVALERLHSMMEKGMSSQNSGINQQNTQVQAVVQAMNSTAKTLDRLMNEQNNAQNRALQLLQNNELNIARMRNDLELAIARMSDQLLKSVQSLKINEAATEMAKLKEHIQKESALKNEIKQAIEKAVPIAVAPALAAAEKAAGAVEKSETEKTHIKKNYTKVIDELRQAREEYRVLQKSSLLELERYKDKAERSEGMGTIILEDLI